MLSLQTLTEIITTTVHNRQDKADYNKFPMAECTLVVHSIYTKNLNTVYELETNDQKNIRIQRSTIDAMSAILEFYELTHPRVSI